MIPWFPSATPAHMMVDQRKTVSRIKLLMTTHKLISFMFAGGAGPELTLPLGRFVPGMQVRVTVTLRTDGGQSADTTVMFTAGDGEN